MTKLGSYPSIYNLGHAAIEDIFSDSVTVEEKVDGSQFSFGLDADGIVLMRSKGQEVIPGTNSMFERAVNVCLQLADELKPGWVYRGEYLMKNKHNTLCYDRIPNQNIAIFDIEPEPGQKYLTHAEKAAEAERLGFEVVPLMHQGLVKDASALLEFLERESFLGGQKIEGVVVKNYSLFLRDGKVALGKYVSEKFKEVHRGEWRKSNPTQSDIVAQLIAAYRTPARWQKAVQHLAERGELQNAPQDIGPLLKEVASDVHKECRDEIAEVLFKHFWKHIQRGITTGMPEWYKWKLLEGAFK